MSKCQSCGNEYDTKEKSCPNCGGDITVYSDVSEDWVPLTTVANEIEFQMTAGLLETAEIPVVKRVRGIDGYLQIILGVPLAGIEILVPKDKHEEALALLNAAVDMDEQENKEPDE